jgi:hypothetical protein
MFWSSILPPPSGSKGKPNEQKAVAEASLTSVKSYWIEFFKATTLINSNPTFIISFFWMSICLI